MRTDSRELRQAKDYGYMPVPSEAPDGSMPATSSMTPETLLPKSPLASDHVAKVMFDNGVPIRESSPSRICCIFPANWVLFPTESKRVEVWDALVGFAICFSAFWVPYQAAFQNNQTLVFDWKFAFDRIMDVIFLGDMILQFFLAFPEEKHGAVRWIKDANRIASNYRRTWFFWDLICVLPFDLSYFYFSGPCLGLSRECLPLLNGNAVHRVAGLRAVRVLRLIRLVRLFRMLRLSRILVRWHCKIGIQYAHLSLIQFISLTILACHWICCLWGALGQAGEFLLKSNLGDGTTWLTVLRVHEMKEDTSGAGRQFSGSANEDMRFPSSEFEIYMISLYFAVASLTSIGYGDIVPTNLLEYGMCIVIMAIGSSIWAYVIGGICGVLSSMDPHTLSFKQNMDDLNAMMKFYELPQEMRRRLRLYVHESRNLRQRKAGQVLKTDLSPALRSEVEMQCNREWMDQIYYLVDLPSEVVAEVAQSLEQALFAPGELIGAGPMEIFEPCLYIVQRGVVARQGRVFGRGSVFGEDMILHTMELRDQSMARAMSFVEVYKLTRTALEKIRNMYPEECKQIRHAQVRMAVRRMFIQKAADEREKMCKRRSVKPAAGLGSLLMAGAPKRKNLVRPIEDMPPWVVSQNLILERLGKMEAFLETRFDQIERRMVVVEEGVATATQPIYVSELHRPTGGPAGRPV